MTINGKPYSTPRNINLRGGILRFDSQLSAAMDDTDDVTLYTRTSGGTTGLYFWNGSSETQVGAAGGGSISSWDQLYDDDKTLTVDSTTLTFSGTHATNDVITLTNSGSGSGDCLQITNSGTGKDVNGTSSTWSVTKAGVLDCTGITIGDDETITFGDGSDITIEYDEDGNDEFLITGATGISGNVNLRSTSTFTQAGNAGSTVFTITAGDAVMSDGSLSITDADNAETVTVINNTATDIGNASSASVVQIESTSLTTGRLLNLQLTEGTLSGGYYLSCWDATGGAAVFSIGENGAVTIAGDAEGTDALTLTAGDVTVTDGDVTLSGGELAVTDGVTTSGAGITLTSSVTTAIGQSIVADSLTTGKGLSISTDAITTGNSIYVENVGEAITSGELLSLVNTESGTLAVKTGSLASITNSMTHTDDSDVTENFDDLAISRTVIRNTGGADSTTTTSQGALLKLSNTITATTGTITDTVNGLEISMDGDGTGSGIDVTHAGVSGSAISVTAAGVGASDVAITGSGDHTNGYGVLSITASGDLAAGGCGALITASGTPNADGRALEIDAQKDMRAAYIDTDAATNDAIYITHSGNLATGKSVLHITDGGIPAADDVAVVKAAFTGTDTNESYIFYAAGTGKDVVGLYVDTDNTVAANSGSIVAYSDDAGAQGPSIVGHHDSASPAANDQVFGLYAYGEEGTSGDTMKYGQMTFEIVAATDGSIEGGVKIGVADAGNIRESFYLTDDVLGLGDSAAFVLGSTGSQDLTISTNVDVDGTNANEPNIVLTDGATGNITITAGGTSGEIDLASPFLASSTHSLNGAGAVSLTESITEWTTTGADAGTLADGVEGQVKYIVMIADGGNGTLTPDNLAGTDTTITFDDIGDAVTLLFTNGEWYVVGQNGVTLG